MLATRFGTFIKSQIQNQLSHELVLHVLVFFEFVVAILWNDKS